MEATILHMEILKQKLDESNVFYYFNYSGPFWGP